MLMGIKALIDVDLGLGVGEMLILDQKESFVVSQILKILVIEVRNKSPRCIEW